MRVSRAVEKLGLAKRFAPLSPDWPIAVIGDIHGSLDQFEQLLAILPSDLPVVCVGNYIDHGPNSAEVLHMLRAIPQILSLKGNHEDMLLGFLRNPLKQGRNWLKHGGMQTLFSFGLMDAADGLDVADHQLLDLRDAMTDAMGDEMINWLANLPASCLSGNVLISHAGANPAAPAEIQLQRHLMWGHRDFYRIPRKDGMWVVHGHKYIPEPKVAQNRIAINTAVHKTGRLTAVALRHDAYEFFATR